MLEYPNKLNIIFDKLKNYNIKPIFVGGFVRDYFLQTSSKDIDIELYNANSFEQIVDILKEFGNTNIIGKSFGIIKFTIDDLCIDFSLPRLDNKISKGHKGFEITINPDLDFKTAALRRDFTINAIGFDINSKKFLDPFNGIDDLKNKTLKIINTKTFMEDPLRILRAMSFCARFELNCDKNLIPTCKEMIKHNMLNELPQSRIYSEFKKLFLKAKKPSLGLVFLKQIDGLDFFYELKMDNKSWIDTLISIDKFSTNKIDDDTTNIIIMLALLCYKMDENNVQNFIYKLTNKKNLYKKIFALHHVTNYLNNKNTKLLYKIAKDIHINYLYLFLNAININNEILKKFNKPIIHGKDILACGFIESKNYSTMLQDIYEEQLNNEINTKDELILKLKTVV